MAMISELPASFDVKRMTATNTNNALKRLAKFTEYHAPAKAIIFDYYANFIPYFARFSLKSNTMEMEMISAIEKK